MLFFISHCPFLSPALSEIRICPRPPFFLKPATPREGCCIVRMVDNAAGGRVTDKSQEDGTVKRTSSEHQEYEDEHHRDHQGGDGDDNGSGKVGNDNSGNSGGDNHDDEDEEARRIVKTSTTQDANSSPTPNPALNYLMVEFPEAVHARMTGLMGRLGTAFQYSFQNVPPQVLVAIIGIITAYFGTRSQEKKEEVSKEEQKIRAAEKTRAEAVARVRENYQSLESVLLKSSILLANRLYDIVEGNGNGNINSAESVRYTTYLIAKYFASVELFKKQSDALALGFPAADRIFANILRRTQSVLAADNEALITIQKSERLFKPADGHPLVNSGPIQILPVAQISLGNILLRSYWTTKKSPRLQIGSAEDATKDSTPSNRSIISYVEFCDLLDAEPVMQKWTRPIEKALRKIEKRRKSNPGQKVAVGSRIFIVQSSLIDLVNFLDPGPRCRYVSYEARRRLRLGKARVEEDIPLPDSGLGIMRALGALRDGMGAQGLMEMTRRERERPLEVYVKASEEATGLVLSDTSGDCPFSQRILLMLETMGVPYKTFRIRNDDKPSWFPMMNGHGRTPVVYSEGHLLSDSHAIIEYLSEKFDNKSVSEQSILPLAVSPARLNRFHEVFMGWLMKCPGGDNKGSRRALAELNNEMRNLNDILSQVKSRHAQQDHDGSSGGGGLFFGGTKFAREDITIIPFLYHVVVAGKELKNWELGEDCEAVADYLKAARDIEAFKKTAADVPAIVAGYGRVLRDGQDRELNLAVELE